MKEFRTPHLVFIFGTLICVLNLMIYFYQIGTSLPFSPSKGALLAQNTYLGPKEPIPGDPQLVRVELLIKDSADLSGVQIQSVTFDGQSVPLKPRDIFGKRGTASFQLTPGKYTLRWTVNRDKIVWPRTISHEEEVIIDPRDLWVQILIVGNQASIR
jgi:hypothetical protein